MEKVPSSPSFRDQPPSNPVDESELPVVMDGQFPPNANTDNERLRFRLCVREARRMFPDEETQVWHAARSLYNNPRVTI